METFDPIPLNREWGGGGGGVNVFKSITCLLNIIGKADSRASCYVCLTLLIIEPLFLWLIALPDFQ